MDLLDRSVKGGARLFTHKGAWEFPESAVTDTRKYEVTLLWAAEAPCLYQCSPACLNIPIRVLVVGKSAR